MALYTVDVFPVDVTLPDKVAKFVAELYTPPVVITVGGPDEYEEATKDNVLPYVIP
jgi:hypothetical protein